MLAYDELYLSDGTITIDLLSLATRTGVHLTSWRAGASRYKGRGYWHDSAVASGRRPAMHLWDAVEERMTLDVVGWTVDDVARETAAIRNFLQQAWDYFEANIPSAVPVYLIRRVQGETNREYSLVLGGFMPEDVDYAAMQSEYGAVSFDGWSVEIWREEHWRDTPPGDAGTCVPNAGYESHCWPCHVEFDANGIITGGNGGILDDLADDAFTAEAWIRIDGGTTCDIVNKGFAAATGWDLSITLPAGAIYGTIKCATDGIRCSVNGSLTADGLWHHLAMTWDDTVDLRPRLWVDGTETAYNAGAGQNRIGAIVSDVGQNMVAANNIALTMDLDGAMGWLRLSDIIRYNAPFTPRPRCFLPDIDVNTVVQWIGDECTGTAIDNMEGTGAWDGTLLNGALDCDCYFNRGNVDPAVISSLVVDYYDDCDTPPVPVHIRNAHVRAQVGHIFTDNGVPSADFRDSSAFNLLPAPPAITDAIYFGITAESPYYGPFFNLVFDIASVDTYTGTWQYRSGGGWVVFDRYDGTNGLTTLGVCSITWEIDADDWDTWAYNGLTGYWVRFVVTGAAANPPVQQNRPVYTTTWAFTEFEDTSVSGDVPALSEIQCILAGEGAGPPGAMTSYAIDRLIFGMRSLSRGGDFCAYLNAGNPSAVGAQGAQEPPGIIVEADAVYGASTIDDTREQGIHALCLDAGATGLFNGSQSWTFQPAYAWQYYGRYRFFARAECTVNNGVCRIRGRHTTGSGAYSLTREYTFTDTNPEKLVDLGLFSIPGYGPVVSTDTPSALTPLYPVLEIETSFTDAGDRIKLYGVILLPADEKIVEAVTAPDGVGGLRDPVPTRMLIDSTMMLRTQIRALARDTADDISGVLLPISAGAVTFQAAADQRIWMVGEQYSGGYWWSPHEFHAKMLLRRVARYRSIRGAR